ncbi:flagellin [Paracoccus sp. p4-l81]|uniref:flagellin N-terminal helical domain-containing protein n=1 Tax=unclassified Paracoccus (in: a-proteobacteria) TaxID=2688777 RepID=UPI0035BB1EE9
MSSILTNNSAMVALQTLKGINASLSKTQDEISTGKTVGSAKDNAAVWAISKVMEADVESFKGISSSLSLGSSTVAVARQAAETTTDLLKQIQGKIVSAQESNVDRSKLQTDITALTDQIKTVVGAAQFNGLNLVNGSAGASVDILASLDRSSTGVKATSITVTTQNLSLGGYTAKAALAGSDGASTAKDTAGFTLNATTGTGKLVIDDSGAAFVAGDKISINVGGKIASYTVSGEDVAATTTSDIVAVGLKKAVDALGVAGVTVDYDIANPGRLAFKNTGTKDMMVTAQFQNAGSGGLSALSAIDVTSDAGAKSALGAIQGLIQTSVTAAAQFGSVGSRIEIQNNFLGKLSDSLKAGIGSLVDADMEEASARLQALQTQQQLGIQSLSIANQAPKSIMSLFRG